MKLEDNYNSFQFKSGILCS